MLPEIIKKLNWIDIFVVIIIFRTLYIAAKNGFIVEFFKLLGVILSIFISLHYYTALSDYLGNRFDSAKMPLEFLDFISFLALSSLAYLIFFFLRNTVMQLIRIEAVSLLNRWGGFILGAARAAFLCALIIFALTISSISYFKESVVNSYSGAGIFKLCLKTYSVLWSGLVSKFSAKNGFNKTVNEVEDRFYK